MNYGRLGKRIFDLCLTIPSLIILGPAIILVAIFVRIKLGSPVLFHQQRPGYRGQPFTIYKFRSMNQARDTQGHLLPDEQRLTSFAKFLRSTSLDELPELLNIIKGEMSLVGPRPLLMEYLARYSPEQMRRHEVLPGLTGWAQVNGRNAISWQERFGLDVWYVDHVSIWLDIKILGLTLKSVFTRENINQPGHATMQKFMGNQEER